MTDPDPADEGLSRAETRLHALLEPLRVDPPRSSDALVGRTLRAARWQRHVRVPLQFAGHLASTVFEAVQLLTRSSE